MNLFLVTSCNRAEEIIHYNESVISSLENECKFSWQFFSVHSLHRLLAVKLLAFLFICKSSVAFFNVNFRYENFSMFQRQHRAFCRKLFMTFLKVNFGNLVGWLSSTYTPHLIHHRNANFHKIIKLFSEGEKQKCSWSLCTIEVIKASLMLFSNKNSVTKLNISWLRGREREPRQSGNE